MAGSVRFTNLETKTARLKLKPGKKCYWRNLVLGRFALGYQRKTSGKPGRWIVRTTLGQDRYHIAPLGIADDYAEANGDTVLSFAEASFNAMRLYRGADGTPSLNIVTVADAIHDYVAWLKAHRATGKDAEHRAAKLILPELGRLRLADLTSGRLNNWREKLAAAPALARTGLGQKQKYKQPPTTADAKRARRASANRTWTILRAALNRAFMAGHIDDDTAWRRVKPFEKVTAARPGFLSVAEAQRLINAADPDFRSLVIGALLTGARYGELRALNCRDFSRGKIHIATSKSGKPRDIVLTEEGVEFFESLTLGHAPDAPIFVRADDNRWEASQQARPMRDACERAKIKPPIGFHQLRHTWASLAVMNGMPLIVVARSLGHATTTMVERHYGHLAETYFDAAVRAGAPRYAVEIPARKVARLPR